jgi:hypothetical protein
LQMLQRKNSANVAFCVESQFRPTLYCVSTENELRYFSSVNAVLQWTLRSTSLYTNIMSYRLSLRRENSSNVDFCIKIQFRPTLYRVYIENALRYFSSVNAVLQWTLRSTSLYTNIMSYRLSLRRENSSNVVFSQNSEIKGKQF